MLEKNSSPRSFYFFKIGIKIDYTKTTIFLKYFDFNYIYFCRTIKKDKMSFIIDINDRYLTLRHIS